MRILFISSVFPNPGEPGRGIFNLQTVAGLAENHTVHIVAPVVWSRDWRLRSHARRSRAAVGLPPGVRIDYPRYYHTPGLFRSRYGKFMWLSTRRAIQQAIESTRPDLVMSYWLHPDGEVAVRAARRAAVPSVVIAGGSDVFLLTRDPARREAIVRVLSAADGVIALSEHMSQALVQLGAEQSKVHVCRRGVDRRLFFPGNRQEARARLGLPADAPSIVWVGLVVPIKRLDVLLMACAKLKARGVAFRLYVVGHGLLADRMRTKSVETGLAEEVRFVGALAHHDLPDWYRAADVTVLCSDSEGTPNALLESIACGTPFVATAVGGVPEIADPGADQLVHPGDVNGLADALTSALERKAEEPRQRRFEPLDDHLAAAELTLRLNHVLTRWGNVE